MLKTAGPSVDFEHVAIKFEAMLPRVRGRSIEYRVRYFSRLDCC